MFKFEDGILKICKFEDTPIKEDIFADQKASYREYINKTVELDINYFCYLLSTIICKGNKEICADVTVGNLQPEGSARELIATQDKYYPVYATFYSVTPQFGKVMIIEKAQILKIPYMDEYCVLNVNGKKKTLINEMCRYEDISYDSSKRVVVVNMKYSYFKFALADAKTNIVVDFRKNAISIDSLLYAFCSHYNIDLDYDTLFSNHFIRRALYSDRYHTDATLDSELSKVRMLYNLIPGFKDAKAYENDDTGKLGHLRESINKRLSLDACIGQTLSRSIQDGTPYYFEKGTELTPEVIAKLKKYGIAKVPIEGGNGQSVNIDINAATYFTLSKSIGRKSTFSIPEGTLISESVLRDIRRHYINEIYVKAIPSITGQSTGEAISIRTLPVGSTITDLVKFLVPELKDGVESITKREYDIDFHLPRGKKFTTDILQLLSDCNYSYISAEVTINKVKNRIEYPFEQEFIGNYTARARDLVDPMLLPDGISGDDWVYYYGIDDITQLSKPNCPDYLTVWDIVGIISLSGRLLDYDAYGEAIDVDLDFSKKINMFNEIFSNNFRKSASKYCYGIARKSLLDRFAGAGKRSKNIDIFSKFSDTVISEMIRDSYLRVSKDQTPIAVVTQANKIMTPVANARAVATGQRMLALGYAGKIDPHDVPQGKNIGIVNTMTSVTRVINGVMHTPYLKLITRNGRKYLDNDPKRVVWLSAEDEIEHVIGDRESLSVKPSGEIEDGLVMARVPATRSREEKQEVQQVSTQKLEYVNAVGVYIVSSGVQTIPFANSDDPVRINFGSSLIQNSIYTQAGEVPHVITDIYKSMYNYDHGFDALTDIDERDAILYCNEFVIKAKDNGYIVDILPNKLIVKYDSLESNTVYSITETKLLNSCVISMSYKKGISERFKKGDILADTPVSSNGCYSPGVNVLLAFLCWDGYNYEDAVAMIKHCAYKFTSVATHKITRELPLKEDIIPTSENLYKYIPKNGVIDTLIVRDGKNKDLVRKIPWKSGEHSGILYDLSVEYSQLGDASERVLVAKLLTLRKLGEGDKVSGRHGNKGTDALLEENSNMAAFYNGYVVQVAQNPLGIVSRMNPGQNKEAPLGFVGFLLGIPIGSNSYNGATLEDIHYLTKFVYDIANAEIQDDYIRSFYRNNQRILIEITKQAKDLNESLVNCENFIQKYINLLPEVDNYRDIGKVKEAIEGSTMIGQDVNRVLSVLNSTINDIDTMLANLNDGIEDLLKKLSKSMQQEHKTFLTTLAIIGDDPHASDAFKGIQKIALILDLLKNVVNKSFKEIEASYDLPKEVMSIAKERFWFIKEWENCFFSDGTALLYNPDTGLPYEGHAAFGMPYYLKIVQEADEKTGARGGMLTERYTSLEHQAPRGANKGGGQRSGEMELAALQAFGASDLVYEIYNVCSDNDGERIKDLCSLLGIDSAFISEAQCHPRTVDLFRYLLEGIGIYLNISDYPDIDTATVEQYKKLKDIGKVVMLSKSHKKGKTKAEVDQEIKSVFDLGEASMWH